ncbi:P-loop containing nucleoside triphosphate hydrolase protein, partial [Mycena vulgaris]
MAHHPSISRIRLKNTVDGVTAAVTTVEQLSNAFDTPFLAPISTITRSILISLQTVKQNMDQCTQLTEQIHQLLYAIIGLHINSGASGELAPSMLHNLGKFTETLNKVNVFVEAQQGRSIIKQFFRKGEMTTLLRDCKVGLQQALEDFKVQGFNLLSDAADMERHAQKIHEEVLELIVSLSDGTNSDWASSMNRVLSTAQNSSNSISMLPSQPKIFHGRESQISDILKALIQESPRIAILGAGGMGKTSLARAVLHHTEISSRYERHRFFVACDTVSTSIELAGLIGAHLGLKPGKDLTKAVVQHFLDSAPCLLVLDNLETCWEPVDSRRDIEEVLSLLTDIPQLALIITMRGAERPAKVRWTRPFLAPLEPLTQEAARQTFIDIAEDFHNSEDIDKLLSLADNMPLAINIIANLVDYEGCSKVLSRWEAEKTALLSEGHDKRSNLELSISLSLSSPRIMALPHSQDLLSLLSILPDGISNVELLQSNLPLNDILACKAALLRTSLGYIDDQRHLKALVPIREYMWKFHPPTDGLVHPLLKHFHSLLEVYTASSGTLSSPSMVSRIRSNFANIQNIL